MSTIEKSLYQQTKVAVGSKKDNVYVKSPTYKGFSTLDELQSSTTLYDIALIKQDIINHALTNNLMDPKSTSHKIYCNKSKKWEPIMLLSSLFKIEVKTYQDNQL